MKRSLQKVWNVISTIIVAIVVILALLLALGWQVWRMQDQLTAAKAQEQQLRQQAQALLKLALLYQVRFSKLLLL